MFKPDQIYMVYDFETYSEVDLKKVGSFEYSMHPSTEVLCVSWMVGTRKQLDRKLKNKEKAISWAPKREWNEHRSDIRNGKKFAALLKDKTIIKTCHNSMFEQAITRNVLPKHLGKYLGKAPFLISHEEFFCTAVQSATHAIPRSLDGATGALGLNHIKDKEGHRLMMRWCKPKKPSKADPSTRYVKDFDRLLKYCEHDIYAEVGLFISLDLPSKEERDLWLFDQEINFRGARVDRDLVQKVLKMITLEKKNMVKELQTITKGFVTSGGQGAVIQKWLKKKGVTLPNLQKKTVDDAIKAGKMPAECKRVLELRQNLNKTSLKKYPNFLNHTTSDGVMRFSLNFRATVHGRWGGAGVQPHNFPRGTLKKKDVDGTEIDLAPIAAEQIKAGMDLEMLRLFYEDPMEVFVSCLRTMIIPREGKELFVSDFSAIEARVLFWLANHADGCKAFVEKRKMYEELAMVIFNRTSISGVTKDERFVGKQAFLLSGYGGGWKKFQTTCEMLGQPVTAEVAKKAINGYRELHAPVPKLWSNLEKAAIAAVEKPGRTFKLNHVEWFMEGKFLKCRLPGGRCIHYYGPQVRYEKTPWGESKAVLYHWTVDTTTKKWTFSKTWGGVLTQNCVGGISADLLAASMLRERKAGYDVILTVHDEIVAEKEIGTGNIHEFDKYMKTIPKWASGCPVSTEGWCGSRYRK